MSHWYILGPNGPQRYRQYNKDGTERKRILRAKALEDGAVESVTTLLQRVSDQNALIDWAGGLGIAAGLRAAREGGDEELARKYYQEEREKGAKTGTAIHDAIEKFLATGELPDDPVCQTAAKSVSTFLEQNNLEMGYTEHCLYFEGPIKRFTVRFGGTTDFVSKGGDVMLDFKTTKADRYGKYWTRKPEHCAQLAAYRLAAASRGVVKPDAKCANIYIDSATGLIIDSVWWPENLLEMGLDIIAYAYTISTLIDAIYEHQDGTP